MTVLSPAAFLAFATACAPGLDGRMLLVQAQIESGLDPVATHQNTNGTRDWGLMQINDSNFALLGIRSPAEVLDPCRNLQAAADLYRTLSRYNSGKPDASLDYARAIVSRMHLIPASGPSIPIPASEPASPFSRPAQTGREVAFSTKRK